MRDQDTSDKRSLIHTEVKGHHIALLTVLIGVFLIVVGLGGSEQVEANRVSIPLDLGMTAATTVRPSADAAAGQEQEIVQPAREEDRHSSWKEIQVRRGDSLALIFGRVGLQPTDLHEILSTEAEAKSLRNIFPGQTVAFEVDGQNRLLTLRYVKSPLEATVFRRTDSGFSVDEEIRTPEIHRAFRHATVNSSLFGAGQEAGLSSRIIMELANIFGGVIDFALDPRAGDTFSVLYEERYLDGEKIGEGSIVAAEYVNEGKSYSAYRFIDRDGDEGYFSADGVSMRKAFLRAPLDFTRVSSNFNLKRLHPVAKVIRPHRGVDYAASTGTPVYASGDGRVAASGYSRANGNYVFVAHANNITTRYLHLHKRTVKAGQRVKQGQLIGTVGSTGLATGPHLHYEFLVNGVHRNPRTVLDNLPRARSLASSEMNAFKQQIAPLHTQLASYTRAWDLAVASSTTPEA